ncbi:MAG: DUF655 domain-containing protein [Nanoarchaeota archaeon]
MKKKEEYAIVLDYLSNGYPLEGKFMPVAQAIGEESFTLLELSPRKGMELSLGERVYIGEGKRDKIYYILGRLRREKLTETSKQQLTEFISKSVKEREQEFVDFFNKAEAINTRLHQLELLPGFGRKHTKEVIEKRKDAPFSSFEDIKNRIPNIPDPERAIEKRIMEELTNIERHNLFIQ